MYQRTFHIARFLPLLGVLLFTSISLQAQNEIVQNDDAVLLRKVWMVRGGVVGGDRVGEGAGGAGDVNHSGQEDFAVLIGRTAEWRIYVDSNGAHTYTPYWKFDSGAGVPWHPVVGDFRGNGNLLVAFARADLREIRGVPHLTARLMFYELKDSLGKQEEPVMVLNTASYLDSSSAYPRDILVSDIDNDGDDDLLLVFGSFLRNLERTARAEIWIYEGGPNFQLDTPTVMLKDTEENFLYLWGTVGDIDGDRYPDILIGGRYNSPPINRMSIWWGQSSLNQLSNASDRIIDLDQTVLTLPPTIPAFIDLDGDHVLDIVGNRLIDVEQDRWEIACFLSKANSARTRLFDRSDAQQIYRTKSLFAEGSLGYLNDSLRRFEVLPLYGPSKTGGVGLFGLSGGKNGPNETIDMIYSASADGMTSGNVFGTGGPLLDATNDGWPDYLCGNPSWFGGDQGIAILLEGGSYIPNDDTTLSVREVATEEHRAALHIWPNPVINELHVAWRGDLKAPPSLLRIFDISGRLVVEQDVDGWRGEAIWKCGAVASGSYLLAVYDRNERVIAQTTVVKQ